MENVSNRMFMECLLGLTKVTKVTKESCCYGYLVTNEKQNIFFVAKLVI